MPNPSINLSDKIPGWGSDLRLEDRPGVPREAHPGEVAPAYLQDIPRQIPAVKIFRTIERPELTPVFGSTCPPRGLSGKLRSMAYEISEGRISRWLTLYLADRVDVLESALLEFFNAKSQVSHPSGAGAPIGYTKSAVVALGVGCLAVLSAFLIRSRLEET